MLKSGLMLLVTTCVLLTAQDSTVFYDQWEFGHAGNLLDPDSLQGREHSVVTFRDGQPILNQHYARDGSLEFHEENQYDSLGNHLIREWFYPTGILQERWVFENELEDIHLFRRIYGDTFKPLNRNYLVHQRYNAEGRETLYAVLGVNGETICHQATVYDDQGRKSEEALVDDLQGITLLERRYRYRKETGQVVLEEYDREGKLSQRVVLYDTEIYPAETQSQ